MTIARLESPTEWRLQRADGVYVAAQRNADGLVDRIAIGVRERGVFVWRGRAYQEAMWGSATAAADSLLLVGHVSGGYVSAALTLDRFRLAMEFADRLSIAGQTPLGELQGFSGDSDCDWRKLGDPFPNVKIDREGRVSAFNPLLGRGEPGISYSVCIDYIDDEVRSVRVV